MKSINMVCTFLIAIALFGCKKDEATGPEQDQFSDRLILGNSMSAFNSVTENTSFTLLAGTVQVFWKLESSVDMAGSAVEIRIEKQGPAGYTPYDSFTYSNPQSYGHIMLSSLTHTTTGSFRATGILVASGRTVAWKNFTVY